MVRKLKEMASPDQNALLDAVFTSAQQIWVAGLGAFARAQKEGSELFDKLVQEGGELQKLTERFTPDKTSPIGGAVSRLAENVSRQASGSWDKLEKVFEDRVAQALRSLGVPSHEDVDALAREVAQLKAQLAANGIRPVKTAGRKAVAKKPAKTAAKPTLKASAKLAAKGAVLKSGARTAAKRAARAASH
jgi:poly(hydroxyalkanoate) granule-associated protein